MKSTDAHRLRHDQLTESRKRAIAAVQSGKTPIKVAKVLGVRKAAVYGWLALYRAGGWDRLDARKRGGRPRKLDGKAVAFIYNAVTLGDPRQYKFPFALWTSRMVTRLVWDKYGVNLSRASVCRLLNQLGLTPQRPIWRAYQQDPAVVQKWLETEYPRIREEAAKAHATVWFGDEAGVRSDYQSGTTWGRRGQTAIVSTTGARFGLNLISAISPRGDLRFMCVKGQVNAGVFTQFLERLLIGAKHPIFLIVDGHPTHRARKVQRYIEAISDKVRLFFLSPYSPELNPDEFVWNDLKNNTVGRKAMTGPDHMKREVLSLMRSPQKSPYVVRSFFEAPTTAYAA